MDSSREELASLASRGEELTQGASYSLQSATSPSSSPQEETHPSNDSPRLQHFDLLACYGSGSQVTQSNPNLLPNDEARDLSMPYHTNQWADAFQGEGLALERSGKGWLSTPVYRCSCCPQSPNTE